MTNSYTTSPGSGNLYTVEVGSAGQMRQVKLDESELRQIKELYEGVMSHACHGLFFREGSVLGGPMAEEALKDRAHYFERAAAQLKERGWVEQVTFSDHEVVVKGSIEASPSDIPACHRLRGCCASSTNALRGGALNALRRCVQALATPSVGFT